MLYFHHSTNAFEGIDEKKLKAALRHPSFVLSDKLKDNKNEKVNLQYNRLEFLGDSILQMIVSSYLYERFPHKSSGELSTMRSFIVASDFLAHQAKKIKLETKLTVSASERRRKTHRSEKVLANSFEVLLCFLYLEHGFNWVKEWLLNLIQKEVDEQHVIFLKKSAKTQVQELWQQENCRPYYQVETVAGLAHQRRYTVALYVEHLNLAMKEEELVDSQQALSRAEGKSVREAEKKCAQLFLKERNKQKL